jgi:hypothetical protein
MPYIMNCLPTPVSTKVFGNWISFTPGQIKLIHNESVAQFISEKRSEEGLVSIPDDAMEMKLDKPEEFKKIIEERKLDGIQARIRKLEWIKENLLSSMAKDMKKANITSDVLLEASKGEKEAFKELKSLRAVVTESNQDNLAEMRQLVEEVNGNSVKSDS